MGCSWFDRLTTTLVTDYVSTRDADATATSGRLCRGVTSTRNSRFGFAVTHQVVFFSSVSDARWVRVRSRVRPFSVVGHIGPASSFNGGPARATMLRHQTCDDRGGDTRGRALDVVVARSRPSQDPAGTAVARRASARDSRHRTTRGTADAHETRRRASSAASRGAWTYVAGDSWPPFSGRPCSDLPSCTSVFASQPHRVRSSLLHSSRGCLQ